MAKLGCQTITWGEIPTREAFWDMAQQIRDCGYDGFEPGLQFLQPEDKSRLEDMGLALIATHTGGDFRGENMDEKAKEFFRTAQAVRALGGEFVFISGAFYPNKTQADWQRDAQAYNILGKAVRDAGLALCYHNHHFEFKKQGLGMQVLLAETDPQLVYLVPDVGWLTRADVEPVDFLKQHGDRVRALHFKEFTFDDHFTELGKGIVDFAATYAYIEPRDLWIIAEQDITATTAVDSARQNARYLQKLTGRSQ